MNIHRGGKSWELTPDELLAAYEEQKAIFSRQNITDNLDWLLEAAGLDEKYTVDEIKNNQELIERAAGISDDLQDSGDQNFTQAITNALKQAVQEMEGAGCLP